MRTFQQKVTYDEGAQRSFVTEELAKTLNLQREGQESLLLSLFGGRKK